MTYDVVSGYHGYMHPAKIAFCKLSYLIECDVMQNPMSIYQTLWKYPDNGPG